MCYLFGSEERNRAMLQTDHQENGDLGERHYVCGFHESVLLVAQSPQKRPGRRGPHRAEGRRPRPSGRQVAPLTRRRSYLYGFTGNAQEDS